MKFWSQFLQYWRRCLEIFIRHFAAAVPLLETDNISQVCWYIIKICPVSMACAWKNHVLLAAFWDKNLDISLGPNGALHCAQQWSTVSAESRSYWLHLMLCYLVNARNWAELTEKSRFLPPTVEVCLVCPQRAGLVFEWEITQPTVRDDYWHYIEQLCICAFTSARAFAATTCHTRPRARSSRSLNRCWLDNARIWTK